jgi:hypothetical protein
LRNRANRGDESPEGNEGKKSLRGKKEGGKKEKAKAERILSLSGIKRRYRPFLDPLGAILGTY